MYNSKRLTLARERRGLTKKALAELAGITTRTLSTYENAENISSLDEATFLRVVRALGYPIEFYQQEDVESVNPDSVSFRALTTLSAGKRNAAIGAGTLALELDKWMSKRFKQRHHNLLDFRSDDYVDPQTAAMLLRDHWSLGELSISNMVHLLEKNGVRVFSLAENCLEVDAFSFWKDNVPFALLNTMKSNERSRFDAAHELGHLVLHKHGSNKGREAEEQADKFASAFLMPEGSVLAAVRPYASLDDTIRLKKFWKVSAAALIRRSYDLGIFTEWHYRQLYIELSKRYGRRTQPSPIEEREESIVLAKVISSLRSSGAQRDSIVREIGIPSDELAALTFDNSFFSLRLVNNERPTIKPKSSRQAPDLRLVKS